MSNSPRRVAAIGTIGCLGALFLATAICAVRRAKAASEIAPTSETLRRPDGKRVDGRLSSSKQGPFAFENDDGGSIPFVPGLIVDFHRRISPEAGATPPFRLFLSESERISGRLREATKTDIRFEQAPAGPLLTIPRDGIVRLAQKPGEAVVFAEAFETLDPKLWSIKGEIELVGRPKLEGSKSARISGRNSILSRKPAAPVGSGRLELSYLDRKDRIEGAIWEIELIFREGDGGEGAPIRVVPGWTAETIAVESPRGPSLVVQPLARIDAWRRLTLKFSPAATSLVIDGLELARGGGVPGPLVDLRFLNDLRGNDDAFPKDLAAFVDDLRLVRSVEPASDPAIDPTQDALRMVSGDQLFGKLDSANAERILFSIDGKTAKIPWSRAISIDFRRVSAQSRAVEGLIVQARWRSGASVEAGDPDRIEGALVSIDDDSIVIDEPRAGPVSIPRDRLLSLQAISQARRIVLDSCSHHLGNDIAEDEADRLNPPQPEGKSLEIPFRLDAVPEGNASLLLDVLQVEGEAPGLRFAEEIGKGELRTDVSINGKSIDYINRHIMSDNRMLESVRLRIPPGLLKSGRNSLRLDQLGTKENSEELDDLGITRVMLEFEKGRR